jgi:hypothetical protein
MKLRSTTTERWQWLAASAAAMTMLLAPLLAVSAEILTARLPTGDGPQDISGVWMGLTGTAYQPRFRQQDGSEAPLTTVARTVFAVRTAAYVAGKPVADTPSRCLPHGVPRSMLTPYPMHIVQTPGQITIVHESGHNLRLIYLNEPQPTTVPLTYMGHSVGHWRGDTLVIDTIGLSAATWLDEAGQPHGERLHVVERLRKLPDGRLENLIELDDPEMYTQSWTTRRVYDPRPDLQLLEYICEESTRDIVSELRGAP